MIALLAPFLALLQLAGVRARALAAELEPASVRRARSQLNLGNYGLGSGGRDPRAADPFGTYQARAGEDPARAHRRLLLGRVWIDCSGFVAWCLGIARKLSNGAWFYTDRIVADARRQLAFEDLGYRVPVDQVRPGDVVAYGSIDRDHDGKRDKIGHTGIVVAVPARVRSLRDVRVIHAAASTNPAGGAVRESSGAPWDRPDAVVFRPWPTVGHPDRDLAAAA